LLTSLFTFSQNLKREKEETIDQFINRNKPNSTTDSFTSVETTLLDSSKNIIIVFFETTHLEENFQIGYLYIPTDNYNNNYQRIPLDIIGTEGGEPVIENIFFSNIDNDNDKEIIVLSSFNQAHYDISGTLYTSNFYDYKKNISLEKRIETVEILNNHFIECNCVWSDGTTNKAKFINEAAINKELKKFNTKKNTTKINKRKSQTLDNLLISDSKLSDSLYEQKQKIYLLYEELFKSKKIGIENKRKLDSLQNDQIKLKEILTSYKFQIEKLQIENEILKEWKDTNNLYFISISTLEEFNTGKANYIENKLIDTNKHIKIKGETKLRLESNPISYKLYTDTLLNTDNENIREYRYLGQYEKIGYYLVKGSFWKHAEYYLINKQDGKTTTIWNTPSLSTSNNFIANLSLYYGLERNFNGLQIWKLSETKNNEIESISINKYIEIDQQIWAPIDLVWLNNTSLILKVSLVENFIHGQGKSDENNFYYLKLTIK